MNDGSDHPSDIPCYQKNLLKQGIRYKLSENSSVYLVDRVHTTAREYSGMHSTSDKNSPEFLMAEIAKTATQSLLDEVNTTPKPGLVDLANNGSHRDMTPETFYLSAKALRDFWGKCFLIGTETGDQPPEICFSRLRTEGICAETKMLEATEGINTHKGAIFTLGTVCGATGRLWKTNGLYRDPSDIAAECARLCAVAVKEDFLTMEARKTARTTGERLYLKYGLRGIRGELADGLPGVLDISLPCFEEALKTGRSRNDAGVLALMHLIARGTDTNVISRGGLETAKKAAEEARKLCADAELSLSKVGELDQSFIRKNLSPGGCADLLAVTYFLYDWKEAEGAL